MFCLEDISWLAAEKEVATGGTAPRAELDEVVGLLHHLKTVLYEDEGVAGVGHLVEEQQESTHIVQMEAVGGFIYNICVT